VKRKTRRSAFKKSLKLYKKPLSETEAILLCIVYDIHKQEESLKRMVKRSVEDFGNIANSSILSSQANKDIFTTGRQRRVSKYGLVKWYKKEIR